ncbi:MBL fold metallo-hydrolase [Candidatus Woesearchaeota archaeon]|nr:MBL fold metallo-hydrolase [Candidatus Woesearchaeota archaeon]
MELEDNYEDIIKKAERGLNKKISSNNLSEVAKYLNLNFKSLRNIKEGKYKPEKFDYGKVYDGLKIKKIFSSFMDGEVNSYIVIDEDNNCVIIDTAQAPEKIIDFVKKEDLHLEWFLKTHEHQDHVEGEWDIWEELGTNNLDFEDLESEPVLNFEKRKIRVFRTPGHSEESLTYQIGKFLFVGDLIFAGSLGGGNYSYKKLLESAKMILSLDEGLFIFPGHGPATTVKEEKENNAFIV